MIHTALAVGFYILIVPFAALIVFPWTFLSGRIDFLYRVGTWIAWTGVRLASVKVEVIGRERLDHSQTYIFMCNHVSNLDPPIVVPLIPRRTSVLVKKELFRVPILGRAMHMGSLVPVDRSNRDAAIASLAAAGEVLKQGINLTVFPEGTRSRDGLLLPFKKGPFYLAMDTGVPVVPMTIVGTYEILPRGRIAIRPGRATLIFHAPLYPRDFPDRDALLAAVRAQIAGPLPPDRRG